MLRLRIEATILKYYACVYTHVDATPLLSISTQKAQHILHIHYCITWQLYKYLTTIWTTKLAPLYWLGILISKHWLGYSEWYNLISNRFCDLLFQLNLINEPTHIQGNILDLIFTNNEDLIYDVTAHLYNYQPIPSDHCIISFSITCSYICHQATYPCKTEHFSVMWVCLWLFYNGLNNNFLSSIDFSVCEQFTDIESIWSIIKDSILDGINTNIPNVRIKPNSSPKWFTSNIRHQIKCLSTLRRKHKCHPIDHT